jgi:hypothetical protein
MPRELREVWEEIVLVRANMLDRDACLQYDEATEEAVLLVVSRLRTPSKEAAAVLAAAEAMAHIIEYGEYGDDISSQSDGLVDAVRAYRAAKGEG